MPSRNMLVVTIIVVTIISFVVWNVNALGFPSFDYYRSTCIQQQPQKKFEDTKHKIYGLDAR